MKKLPFFGEVGIDILAADIEKELRGDEDVTLLMDSVGGDVFQGMAIYNMLKGYEGKTTVDILGMSGSIASIIALGADSVRMSETASFFLHNALVPQTGGNAAQLRETADTLEQVSNTIQRVYAVKTDLPDADVKGLMDEETVLNADDALRLGFVDEIIHPVAIAAKFEINMNKLSELRALTNAVGVRLGIKNAEVDPALEEEVDQAIVEEVATAVDEAAEVATELEAISGMVTREEFEMKIAEILALLQPMLEIAEITPSEEEVTEMVEAKTTTKIAAVLKAMKSKTTIPSAANNFKAEDVEPSDRLKRGFLQAKQNELRTKNGH